MADRTIVQAAYLPHAMIQCLGVIPNAHRNWRVRWLWSEKRQRNATSAMAYPALSSTRARSKRRIVR